jgi:hypothetical protein
MLVGIKRQFGSVAVEFVASWSPDDWHRAFSLSAEATRNDTSLNAITRDQYISNANLFAASLQVKGTIPRFELPPGVENAHLSSIPKRAVSEVITVSQHRGPPALLDADQATVEAWEHLSKLTDISDPAVMHERLTIILARIRLVAEQGIRKHQAAHATAMAQIDVAEHARISRFLAENKGRSSRSMGSGRGSKSAFSDKSSVLSYIEYEFGGMPPTRFEAPALARLIYNRYSMKEIVYGSFLTTETAIYYLIIILIDTAMNVSSALSLSIRSMTRIDVGDYYNITWYKDRASDYPMQDSFLDARNHPKEQSIGIVEVMETLQSLNARLRNFALPEEADLVFLVGNLNGPRGSQGKYRAGSLSEHIESKAWHRIRKRDPILSELPITLDMIRSSILLLECLDTNNNIFAINSKAHHENYRTTSRYMQRVSVNTLNVTQVRTVQDFLVAAATENLADVRKEIGMTPERAAKIVGEARRKGFGSWASMRDRHHAEPGDSDADPVQDALSDIEKWLVAGENLLLADETVAAELSAFRAHILKEKSALLHTPSWTETWAPLLMFLNMAIEAFPPSLRLRGEELAEEMEMFYTELD